MKYLPAMEVFIADCLKRGATACRASFFNTPLLLSEKATLRWPGFQKERRLPV